MKVRTGFVSNSSSSSYVIIGDLPFIDEQRDFLSNHIKDNVLYAGFSLGEIGFGWGPDTITDIGSRINLAIISDNFETERVLKAIQIHYPEVYKIVFLSEPDAYIDHQSIPEIARSLSDDVSLYLFIFCKHSLIELDHDNH